MDRVAPSDEQTPPEFCGGNLQGVAEKMDYIAELGANAIWLTPFHGSAAYHGYHVTDYFRVAEQFGGQSGFDMLVKAAKARGIKLIMDFVPNHVHETHPWFVEAKSDKRSPRRDWFYWLRNGGYLQFLDFTELPKLNLDHPDARAEIFKAARHWLDQGIDGFRLDHALGPSMDFWREFASRMKHHNEDCALIGEVWFEGVNRKFLPALGLPDKRFYIAAHEGGFDVMEAVMREYTDIFDALLDFPFQKMLKTYVARAAWPVSKTRIQAELDRHYAGFPEHCRLLSFLDNHDMNRFLFEAGGDKSRLKKAVEIQFSQRQPPVIYYGDEIGMSQRAPIQGIPYGDQRARRLMSWQRQDREVLECYKREISRWKASGA